MSIEIGGGYGYYKTNYEMQLISEKGDEVQTDKIVEKVSDKNQIPQVEYISSEESGVKSSGLYRLGQDENGNPKVLFDEFKKSSEKYITNTDKVDREIKKLKEEKNQLEQQIKMAAGDEEKVKELEKELALMENELSKKDNDTYRRQNAGRLEVE